MKVLQGTIFCASLEYALVVSCQLRRVLMIHFYPSGDRHDFRIEQQKRQEETTFAKHMMRQSRYVGPCSLRDRSFVLFLYRTECFVISAEVVSGRFVD